jgi:hypothetical protein
LQLPANVKISTGEDFSVVNFSWDPQITVPAKNSRHDDHVNIVCLDSGILQETHAYNVAKRSEGKATFVLPKGWLLKTSHFWIFLTSYDLENNSDSLYLNINNQPLANKSLTL